MFIKKIVTCLDDYNACCHNHKGDRTMSPYDMQEKRPLLSQRV